MVFWSCSSSDRPMRTRQGVLARGWIFLKKNSPKCPSKSKHNWFGVHRVELQTVPDLNPSGNLCRAEEENQERNSDPGGPGEIPSGVVQHLQSHPALGELSLLQKTECMQEAIFLTNVKRCSVLGRFVLSQVAEILNFLPQR